MLRLQSHISICLGLLVASVTVKAATPRHGWHVHYQGNFYFIPDDGHSWPEARDACAEEGGHLVEIGSEAEQNLLDGVVARIPGGSLYWIGLNDRFEEGRFVWENTGRPGFYTNWIPGQPANTDAETGGEENCVHIYSSGRPWNDMACGDIARYICEL